MNQTYPTPSSTGPYDADPSGSQTDQAPADQTPADPTQTQGQTPAGRTRPRRTLRALVAAGATAAVLAVGGVGFGAGYAVGHTGAATEGTAPAEGDQQFTGPGGGQGMPPGSMDVSQAPPGTQGQSGTEQSAPDLDGDGQPDTETTTPGGTTEESAVQS
ncbi:MAG: hypothetical protein ACI379_08500 [Nocardioides sp.]|uniref:hypothetical protein n=1 Tax=Nocardioides sp. TaxID=35761 RepID=UPI003EFF456D